MISFLNKTDYTLIVDIGLDHDNGSCSVQQHVVVPPKQLLTLPAGSITSVHISQVIPPPTPPQSEEEQMRDELIEAIEQTG